MHTNPTDDLCTRCGLCCDGTLFADVELAGPVEADRLEALGLTIDDGESRELLVQPCAALRGTRCTVYAQRPACCRTFKCRLLADLTAGRVELDAARARVTAARAAVRRLNAWLPAPRGSAANLPLRERVAEWLARGAAPTPASAAPRREVAGTLRALERHLRAHFLSQRRQGTGSSRRPSREPER